MEEFPILQSPTSFPNRESDGHFCLSWCPNLYGFKTGDETPMLAIGCGKENAVRIFRMGMGEGKKREWAAMEVLPGHGDLVHDVAWAPNVGRYGIVCVVAVWRVDSLLPFGQIVSSYRDGVQGRAFSNLQAYSHSRRHIFRGLRRRFRRTFERSLAMRVER